MKKIISFALAAVMTAVCCIAPFKSSEEAFSESSITAEASSQLLNVTVNGTENYDEAYKVLSYVNAKRASLGLTALTMDKQLLEAAMQRAAELSVYYDHDRPNGESCVTAAPREFNYFAENIAINQRTSLEVSNAWFNSTDHYNNIVNTNMKSIGIGCYIDKGGTISWVQLFDNMSGSDPKKSGNVSSSRDVEILSNNLSFSVNLGDEQYLNSTYYRQLQITLYNNMFPYSYAEAVPSSFNYKSLNTDIASVDADGKITGLKTGTATIRVSPKPASSLYKDITVSFNYPEAPTSSVEHYDMKVTAYSLGDVNGDEYINAADSSVVLYDYAVTSTGGASALTAKQKTAANINSDTAVNSSDASMILSYYAYTATGGSDSIQKYFNL